MQQKTISRNELLQQLIDSQHNGLIKIVTGLRRSGKSYLLFRLFYDYLCTKGVPQDHFVLVNLEDKRNEALRDANTLLQYIDDHLIDSGQYYVFLDEIQKVAGFEDVLNSYLNKSNVEVYVTGSNSKFLSTDIITTFRGRSWEIRVHPLSFQETMAVHPDAPKAEVFQEYMMYGGLPQVVLFDTTDRKEQYLWELFETTYLRDIKERYGIRDDGDLAELVDILASTIGSLTNPTTIQRTFQSVKKSTIAVQTIQRFIGFLQDAFMLERAVRYDVKGRRYIDTPSKYYFEDVGLRNARLNFRQIDYGHLMENVLYNDLRRRGYNVDVGQITCFSRANVHQKIERQQLEVDFVCNRASKRVYIQSVYNIPSTLKELQETRSLMQIDDSFEKILVLGNYSPTYQNDEGIKVISIFDFLLSD